MTGAARGIVVPAVTVALAALIAVYHANLWGSLDGFVKMLDHGRVLFADFELRFYPVGRDFLETGKIYPGYYYSAFFLLVLAPFGDMSAEGAARAWGAVQIACTIGLAALPARHLWRRSTVVFSLYVVLFLISIPILHNFVWGQVSVPLTLGVLGCLFLHRAGRPVPAAVLLALTVTVKYYTAVFLFWFLLRRDYRFLVAFVISVVVFAAALPMIAFGPGTTVDFYRQVADNLAADEGRIVRGPNSQYFASVAQRWAMMASGSRPDLPPEATGARTILTIGGWLVAALHLLFVGRLARRTAGPAGSMTAFAILAGVLPFVVPTSWPHYFAHLPFFQAWAAATTFRDAPGARTVALRGTLLALSVGFSSVFLFDAVGDWRAYVYGGPLFLSNLFLLVLFDVLSFRSSRASLDA